MAGLAAVVDRCVACQERVAGWLAAHGDPWAIVRLAGPIASDAHRLASRWLRTGTPRIEVVRQLLLAAFGRDVANVSVPIVAGHDLAGAVAEVRSLGHQRRHAVIRSLLHGAAHPVPPALLAFAARLPI